jgi:hypothetical protein
MSATEGRDVFAEPVEVRPGKFKPLGECDADDLEAAAELCRVRGDEAERQARFLRRMAER